MGLDRRGFIQFIVGGAVGSLFTPIPWKLTDDLSIWTQNWPWIPRNIKGANAYASTLSKLCPTNCALKVRTVGGHPVRAIGDPDNPLSGGKLSSIAASEVQLLYSPGRLKRPLRKSADGAFRAISWGDAVAIMEEKLGSIKGLSGKLAVISGDPNGTINEVLAGFAAQAGSDAFFVMPCEAQSASRVWQGLLGQEGQLGFDIENSDYVLALGADILESWGPAVSNRRAYSAQRPLGEAPKTQYIYAGPVQNNTAAGSDRWVPVKPGTEAVLAAVLCNLLIQKGKTIDSPDFDAFKTVVGGYSTGKAAAITGVPEAQINQLADELLKASKPLVIFGSAFGQGAGAALVLSGIGLNLLANGLNNSGGLKVIPEVDKAVSASPDRKTMFAKDLVAYLQEVEKGQAPEMLLVYEANPVYALPQPAVTAEALKKIPFKVSFTCFLDETAMACDLVLPNPMGLERFDDICNPYGLASATYNAMHPVIAPLVDAAPAGDVLLDVAKRLNMSLGFDTFKQVLEAKAANAGGDFKKLRGSYTASTTLVPVMSPPLGADVLNRALASIKSEGIGLAPVNNLNYGTAQVATPPLNLKTVRDTVLLGDRSFVHMNGATASKLGVTEGSLVKVSSEAGECTVLVHIFEGVMDDVVAAPLGFGRTAFDEFTRGKGSNTAQLMTAAIEPGSGFPVWTSTSVKIAKI